MRKQTPIGDENLVCPLHKKKMAEVCHKCPWWVHVRGRNPNTGEEVDQWNCAIAWGPMLAVNTAQQARETGAAVESFRNEVVRRHDIGGMSVITPPKRVLSLEAREAIDASPTVLDARRLRYGLVRGHPTSKSQEQTVFRHPVSAGRIRDYHLFSAKDQSSVLPSIAGLLRSRGPIAVLFAVVAFVVSSLKAGSLGALSHVIKKCLKTTIPFFGNVDAATTVSVEVRPMRLRTTSTHVHPNSVFCCVGAPVRLIDASEVFAALVPLSASAGCGAPAKQARGERNKPAHPAVAIACGVSLRSISYAKAPESFSWDNESTLDSILTLSAPTGNSATPTKCI